MKFEDGEKVWIKSPTFGLNFIEAVITGIVDDRYMVKSDYYLQETNVSESSLIKFDNWQEIEKEANDEIKVIAFRRNKAIAKAREQAAI